MLVLIEHMPGHPSTARISEQSGFGRLAVLEAIRTLESAGWLRVGRRNGGRSSYELTAPKTSLPDRPVEAQNQSVKQTGTSLPDRPVEAQNQSARQTGSRACAIKDLPLFGGFGGLDPKDLKGLPDPERSEPLVAKDLTGSAGARAGGEPKRKRAKNRTPLPEDFEPNASCLTVAREHGADPEIEFPQFVDHHRKHGSLMADWQAAFRTWLRNARKFGGARGRSQDENIRQLLDRSQRLRAQGE